MIVSVSTVMQYLREIDRCENPVRCIDIDTMKEGVDTCNCEMMCQECAQKFFQMLVWTRDEDTETVVSA